MKRILEPEVMQSLEEVMAFEKIVSKTGWVLHNPFVKLFLNLIEAKDQSKHQLTSVLDIGTGTACIPLKIIEKQSMIEAKHQSRSMKIYGLDFSANMLKTALEKINPLISKNIILIQADAKRLPFKNHCFDAVISSNFFHHLSSPSPVLEEINRVVKTDGLILIRDLLRPPAKLILNLLVAIVSLFTGHDRLMRKEYRDSLCGAFTAREWREILSQAPLKGAKFFTEFPHYITIVKK